MPDRPAVKALIPPLFRAAVRTAHETLGELSYSRIHPLLVCIRRLALLGDVLDELPIMVERRHEEASQSAAVHRLRKTILLEPPLDFVRLERDGVGCG